VLLGTDLDGDPFEAIKEGRPPSLKALRLHNGTIYRWNRPCYGISDNGKPHLRIENRVVPSGPTVIDAVSNAAFFFGLMSGMLEEYDDITRVLEFDDVKTNFLSAARLGLGAQFTWIDQETFTARDLICDKLIPMARRGLEVTNIDPDDIDRYLGVVQERVEVGQTGSQWLLKSLASFKGVGTKAERLAALTAATYNRQVINEPVHKWTLANLDEAGGWESNYVSVEQYMNTDVLTVNENELVELVANIMDWHNIRHVPVEDNEHRLVGLVSHRDLLRLLGKGVSNLQEALVPVKDIMQTNPLSVPPSMPTVEAIALMRARRIACLPVVYEEKLVGIVTERDFMKIAGVLLQETLEKV
jgi:CBS domain-containing protein